MMRFKPVFISMACLLMWGAAAMGMARAGGDLEQVMARGQLRHLGVPYANFITGSGDGLDVELVQGFAAQLGVTYVYVETDWAHVIVDLTGEQATARGDEVDISGTAPIRGDLVANGFTILPWRQKIVSFSRPTFPTQVWLVTTAASTLTPIAPSGSTSTDIAAVKNQLGGISVLGIANTCLDPSLYGIAAFGAAVTPFQGKLNELAPAVVSGVADATLLDVPDALIALDKWGGAVKVVGPISGTQQMGVGFRKESPKLREAFDRYLAAIWRNGTYQRLVQKYYPAVFEYYPDFFDASRAAAAP